VANLPAFVQQHQGVTDPLNNPTELAKLVTAVLGRFNERPARLTDEPFVGLRAMTEREADRFFGREAEVDELVDDLRRNRLVAIVADSGAGKSSLAMAGLAPAFRGGALADPARREPNQHIWHVVVMRPGSDPLEGLRRGVSEAAERMGLSPEARAGLRRRLSFDDANEAAYALRCDLPAATNETLLIVDQFDELLTETPEQGRAPFIDFLLNLTARRGPGGFRVVLTVRVDYFNLCRPFEALYAELQNSDRVLRLKRISDAGLEEAVRKPLRMAGYADEREQASLANEMRRDLGDRPGDLALAQMALWTVWRNRRSHDGSLLRAYVDVGRVSGALAQEAERIRTQKLNEAERALLPALFVRLVRLGETGGVLRRIATKEEVDRPRQVLADKLASDEYGRLLLVGEAQQAENARVEVCHEALITQWPWLQNTLNAAAADVRSLERLMDRAVRWRGAPEAERDKNLATGAERELFADLCGRRDDWLSAAEREFVAESEAAFAREQRAKRILASVLGLAAVALLALTGIAFRYANVAEDARQEAVAAQQRTEDARQEAVTEQQKTEDARQEAVAAQQRTEDARQEAIDARDRAVLNQSRFLIGSAVRERQEGDPATAMLLALEALPDNVERAAGNRQLWSPVEKALRAARGSMRESVLLKGHERGLWAVAVTRDGSRIVTGSDDHTARVWDARTGTELLRLVGHTDSVRAIALTPDDTRIVTGSRDGTARVWDARTGAELQVFNGHRDSVLAVAVTPSADRIVTGSKDNTARIWDASTGAELLVLKGHDSSVSAIAVTSDGSRIITGSADKTARVWDAATGASLLVLQGHQNYVWSVASDGQRIITGSEDHTARVWNAKSGVQLSVLRGHQAEVYSVGITPDGTRYITGSADNTARVWDARTGAEIATLRGHVNEVRAVAVSPDGAEIITGAADGTARIWHSRGASEEKAIFNGHTHRVYSIAVMPDGERVVTGSADMTARVWDSKNGSEGVRLNAALELDKRDAVNTIIFGVAVTPDGSRVIEGAPDEAVHIWDTKTWKEVGRLKGHTGTISGVTITPDGKRIITTSWDKTARVWDMATGAELAVLRGHSDGVERAAVTPDGTRILTVSLDKTIRIWDASTWAELAVIKGHDGGVHSVVVMPDGRRFVTGSGDDTARVWDLASGAEVLVLRGHQDTVSRADSGQVYS
jgi:WD40 repeat protein